MNQLDEDSRMSAWEDYDGELQVIIAKAICADASDCDSSSFGVDLARATRALIAICDAVAERPELLIELGLTEVNGYYEQAILFRVAS